MWSQPTTRDDILKKIMSCLVRLIHRFWRRREKCKKKNTEGPIDGGQKVIRKLKRALSSGALEGIIIMRSKMQQFISQILQNHLCVYWIKIKLQVTLDCPTFNLSKFLIS